MLEAALKWTLELELELVLAGAAAALAAETMAGAWPAPDWKMSRSSPLVGSSPSSTTGSAGFRGRRGGGAVAIGAATGAAAGKELVRQLAAVGAA
jgi:hypothetical protein